MSVWTGFLAHIKGKFPVNLRTVEKLSSINHYIQVIIIRHNSAVLFGPKEQRYEEIISSYPGLMVSEHLEDHLFLQIILMTHQGANLTEGF